MAIDDVDRLNGRLAFDEASVLLARVGTSQDLAAFEALYRYFAPRLKAYMLRLAANGAQADELMQETMIKVWQRSPTFDPEKGRAATWIFTIARNVRIDALRQDRRPVFDPNDPAFIPDNEASAEEAHSERQTHERLSQAIGNLPREQEALIRLSYFDGLSHSVIAGRLALPIGTVKSRLRLAFNKLREAMGEL